MRLKRLWNIWCLLTFLFIGLLMILRLFQFWSLKITFMSLLLWLYHIWSIFLITWLSWWENIKNVFSLHWRACFILGSFLFTTFYFFLLKVNFNPDFLYWLMLFLLIALSILIFTFLCWGKNWLIALVRYPKNNSLIRNISMILNAFRTLLLCFSFFVMAFLMLDFTRGYIWALVLLILAILLSYQLNKSIRKYVVNEKNDHDVSKNNQLIVVWFWLLYWFISWFFFFWYSTWSNYFVKHWWAFYIAERVILNDFRSSENEVCIEVLGKHACRIWEKWNIQYSITIWWFLGNSEQLIYTPDWQQKSSCTSLCMWSECLWWKKYNDNWYSINCT